ncbi:hypothetical protein D9M72_352720 [compost metagenome]
MQLDRGQRRAQLVRRIGNELALRVERVAQPRQQRIEAADQRRHLGRHLGLVQRGERAGSLPVELVGQDLQRHQLFLEHVRQDQAADQQQQDQRHRHRQQDLVGGGFAPVQQLGHLDHDGPARGLAGLAGAELVHRGAGQHHRQPHRAHLAPAEPRVEQPGIVQRGLAGAVAEPRVHAADQAIGAVDAPVDAVGALGLDQRLRDHRDVLLQPRAGDADLLGDVVGHAVQRAVEHLRGVVRRQPVGQRAAGQHQREQRRRQRAQQVDAQADVGAGAGGLACRCGRGARVVRRGRGWEHVPRCDAGRSAPGNPGGGAGAGPHCRLG